MTQINIDEKLPELYMAALDQNRDAPQTKQHERKGYALSENEAELVRIVKAVLDVAMRPKFREIENGQFVAVIDDEVKAAALSICAGEKPPINWRKALQISNRVLSGKWYSLSHMAHIDSEGQMTIGDLTSCASDFPIFRLCMLRTSEGDIGPIIPERYPEFYCAKTLADKRKALGLSSRYKFLSLQELAAVKTVREVCGTLDKVSDAWSYAVPSNDATNALANIGRRAVDARTVTKGKNGVVIVKNEDRGITALYPAALDKKINLLSDGAARLHDQVVSVVHAAQYSGNKVIIPLDEYMEARGLKDKKSALEKLRNETDALYQLSVEVTKADGSFDKTRLFERAKYDGRVGSGFILTGTYMAYLTEYRNRQPMHIPKSFFKLPGRGPDYFIARRICEHYRNNVGKPNANSIGVKTLLEASSIITYEALQDKGQASQKIIEPFTRALDRIADTGELDWEFAYSSRSGKKGALSAEDLDAVYRKYDTFADMMIRITWHNKPDYDGLLESKARQIAAKSQPKRKRGRPRKNPEN